jgi:hypothetical protein
MARDALERTVFWSRDVLRGPQIASERLDSGGAGADQPKRPSRPARGRRRRLPTPPQRASQRLSGYRSTGATTTTCPPRRRRRPSGRYHEDRSSRRDTDASFDAVALEMVQRRRERSVWARSLPRPTDASKIEGSEASASRDARGAAGSDPIQSRPKGPCPSGAVRSVSAPARAAIRPARATRARVRGRSPPFASGNPAWRACCGRACRPFAG